MTGPGMPEAIAGTLPAAELDHLAPASLRD
jgi:hypothetical protein